MDRSDNFLSIQWKYYSRYKDNIDIGHLNQVDNTYLSFAHTLRQALELALILEL